MNWFKNYFRTFIKSAPENLKIGDKMTFAIIYYDKDGKPSKPHIITEVYKKDL